MGQQLIHNLADEPRRSVRATKGQHTKSLDLLDQPAEPKKKGSKKSKKAAVQEEEPEEAEVIRCVCGASESPPDDPEPWIACDNCGVWQHNVCVGVSTYDDEVPKNYLCEQCDPEFHKDLLEALKHGKKLWEERRRAFEKAQAEEEQEGPKKRGKKKGKRTSDPKSEISHANGKTQSPAPAGLSAKKPTPVRTPATKRKARDDSHDQDSKVCRKS